MADATNIVWETARAYAENGIYVAPVYVSRKADGKKNVRPAGLWRDISTTSQETINRWEKEHPKAGLLIDCGKSKIVVVDPDGPEGIEAWQALDQPEPLWIVDTAGGGQHWYYRAHPDHVVGNDQDGKVAPNVDVRGLGGFVIAPPSSDGAGQWRGRGAPDWSADRPVPALVIERMKAPAKAVTSNSTATEVIFDDAPADARSFTVEQAKDYIRAERTKLTEAGQKVRDSGRRGYNGLINNFAMACAHFPWLVTRGQCGGHMIKALGPVTGWTAPDADDVATIDSAYKATEAGKSWVAVRVEGVGAPSTRITTAADGSEPEDRWTDAMLSGRLAREEFADNAIYATALGWLRWDGRRWACAAEEVMQEAARKWVLRQYAAAVLAYRALPAPDHKLSEDPAVRGWAGAQSASRLAAIVRLARGILLQDASDFDRDPDLLNTPGGVVDLRTGESMAHDPKRLITKITGAAYVPGAESMALKQALEAVPDDARDWLQRRLGEAATGHSGEQLVLLSGTGRNGKTLIMGATFRALGDYAAKVPNTLLLRTRAAGGATPEKMTLRGVRLAYMEETPEDGYLDATTVKDLLDAEEIEGRHLYKDIVSWRPTHSMFLNTNHPPTMGDTGDAAWRRLTRLDFPYRFRKAGEEIESDRDRSGDPGLKQALSQEQAGQEALLAWIVAGARGFYQAGTEEVPPASVTAGIRKWREESDDLLRFIAQEMSFDPDGWVARSDMYTAFAQWLRLGGQKAPSVKTFGQRMVGHSILARKIDHGYVPRDAVSRPEGLLLDGLAAPLAARVHAYGGLSFSRSETPDQGR